MPELMFEPLEEAIAKLNAKSPIGSGLSSREWEEVPLALRERAFFSARVESARALTAMQERLRQAIAMERELVGHRADGGEKRALVDRAEFIASMRAKLKELGVQTAGSDGAGSLQDIRSARRLGLIFDMQTKQAAEYTRWKMGHDPDVLDSWPAQRLVRLEPRRVPRDWDARWQRAGEATGWAGALTSPKVALKTSPIWQALSRFGTPWPPYDFGSGMGLEDLSRDDAEQLGLLQVDEPVPATGVEDFNANLEASVKGVDPALRQELLADFGDQVRLHQDTIKWVPDAVQGFVEKAARERQWQVKPIQMGRATLRTVEASERVDLRGTQLTLRVDDARHLWDRHGAESVASSRNIPLRMEELRHLPLMWRDPDDLTWDGVENVVVLWRLLPDGAWLRAAVEKSGPKTVRIMTVNKTPTGPDGAGGE